MTPLKCHRKSSDVANDQLTFAASEQRFRRPIAKNAVVSRRTTGSVKVDERQRNGGTGSRIGTDDVIDRCVSGGERQENQISESRHHLQLDDDYDDRRASVTVRSISKLRRSDACYDIAAAAIFDQ